MIKDIIEEFKNKYGKIKLDLGCGSNKHGDDYIGIDISDETDANIIHDLNMYPWPFEDNSIDEVYCENYVEHIPHDTGVKEALFEANTFEEFKKLYIEKSKLDGYIKFFNELYRIMKPESKAIITVPYYTSVRAFGDPTHHRYVGDFSLLYLNKEWRENNKLTHYGLTVNFDIYYSFNVDEEMSLRSESVRNKAFKENWNAIANMMAELIKK